MTRRIAQTSLVVLIVGSSLILVIILPYGGAYGMYLYRNRLVASMETTSPYEPTRISFVSAG